MAYLFDGSLLKLSRAGVDLVCECVKLKDGNVAGGLLRDDLVSLPLSFNQYGTILRCAKTHKQTSLLMLLENIKVESPILLAAAEGDTSKIEALIIGGATAKGFDM